MGGGLGEEKHKHTRRCGARARCGWVEGTQNPGPRNLRRPSPMGPPPRARGESAPPPSAAADGLLRPAPAPAPAPAPLRGARQVVEEVVLRGMRPHFPRGTPPSYEVLAAACWAAQPGQRPSFPQIISQLQEMLAAAEEAAGGAAAGCSCAGRDSLSLSASLSQCAYIVGAGTGSSSCGGAAGVGAGAGTAPPGLLAPVRLVPPNGSFRRYSFDAAAVRQPCAGAVFNLLASPQGHASGSTSAHGSFAGGASSSCGGAAAAAAPAPVTIVLGAPCMAPPPQPPVLAGGGAQAGAPDGGQRGGGGGAPQGLRLPPLTSAGDHATLSHLVQDVESAWQRLLAGRAALQTRASRPPGSRAGRGGGAAAAGGGSAGQLQALHAALALQQRAGGGSGGAASLPAYLGASSRELVVLGAPPTHLAGHCQLHQHSLGGLSPAQPAPAQPALQQRERAGAAWPPTGSGAPPDGGQGPAQRGPAPGA
jgi:hypothetical protein